MKNSPLNELTAQDIARKQKKLGKIEGKLSNTNLSPKKEQRLKERKHKTEHQIETGERGRPTSLRNEAWMAGTSRKSSSQETKATAKDSSFVKQNHPSFTGGYFSRTVNDMENRPDNLPKPTRKMDSDHMQSNKIREQRALGLAKNKGIDVENWVKSDSPVNNYKDGYYGVKENQH